MKDGGHYAMILIAAYIFAVLFLTGGSHGDLNMFFLRNQWVLGVGIVVAFITVILVLPSKPEGQAVTQTITETTGQTEYCIHCGASLPVGAKFCKKCGKPQA